MSRHIKSIQKGDAPYAIRFRKGDKYARITEEWKTVRMGEGTKYEQLVYRVYDKDEQLIAEIESSAGLVILYDNGENADNIYPIRPSG